MMDKNENINKHEEKALFEYSVEKQIDIDKFKTPAELLGEKDTKNFAQFLRSFQIKRFADYLDTENIEVNSNYPKMRRDFIKAKSLDSSSFEFVNAVDDILGSKIFVNLLKYYNVMNSEENEFNATNIEEKKRKQRENQNEKRRIARQAGFATISELKQAVKDGSYLDKLDEKQAETKDQIVKKVQTLFTEKEENESTPITHHKKEEKEKNDDVYEVRFSEREDMYVIEFVKEGKLPINDYMFVFNDNNIYKNGSRDTVKDSYFVENLDNVIRKGVLGIVNNFGNIHHVEECFRTYIDEKIKNDNYTVDEFLSLSTVQCIKEVCEKLIAKKASPTRPTSNKLDNFNQYVSKKIQEKNNNSNLNKFRR